MFSDAVLVVNFHTNIHVGFLKIHKKKKRQFILLRCINAIFYSQAKHFPLKCFL